MTLALRTATLGAALGATAALSLACGTNRPDIPEYLLKEEAGVGAANYPAGPYCSNPNDCTEGATVENFIFDTAWRDPAASGYDLAKIEKVSFADFYDPQGTKTVILMVNTAAFWCGACVIEHGTAPTLNDHYDELSPRGFALLSLVFQDAKNNPASPDNLKSWAENFETHFPLAADPSYQMGRYAASQSAPLNLVIDARTMKILHAFLGDQSEQIWPFIASKLTEAGK